MIDSKIIGQRIKGLRKSKGLSQFAFAVAIGISNSAVASYECGERIPRDEIKVKIADFFGKTVQEIFFEE